MKISNRVIVVLTLVALGGPAHFQNKQSGCLDRTGKLIWVDTD